MKEDNATIKLFEKYAHEYDEMQPVLLPFYEDIISMVAEAYCHYAGEGNFLDLGCGTGNVSLRILKESPGSKMFLLDGSNSMLETALEKIRTQFDDDRILGSKAVNLENANWHQGIGGSFDAIVTAYVLEHLREPDYRAVIKKCREFLKPGGAFISVEWSDDEYGMKEWFVEMMKHRAEKYPQYRPAIEESLRTERHYFVNINEKLKWIRGAGYKNVHTIWQNLFGYIVVSER